MIDKIENAPCLVDTKQGVYVLYKNQYLYSKYAPQKAIQNIISNSSIKEDTLVIVFSPVLFYGINELLQKLNSNCKVICFELDKTLFEFSRTYHANLIQNNHSGFLDRIEYYNDLTQFFTAVENSKLKRIIRFDFSAGVNLYKNEYEKIFNIATNILNQFWKNRLTLIKFGRLYSKNIFKNFRNLVNSIDLRSLYNTVTKPIIVCGAGESLDNKKTLSVIKNNREKFYIIAVDAALNNLITHEITPDCVVVLESQQVTQKFYIGKSKNSKILLISDLVANVSIPKFLQGPKSYYISDYAKLKFFSHLQNEKLLPPVIKPLGSVGLTATQIALNLRKDDNVKIFITGLDFSYSCGVTHAKNTLAHINQLITSTKIKSIYNVASSFADGVFRIATSPAIYTSQILTAYTNLFIEQFSDKQNLFDLRNQGVNLNLQPAKLEDEIARVQSDATMPLATMQPATKIHTSPATSQFSPTSVTRFLETERDALLQLKDLLRYTDKSIYRDANFTIQEQIENLISQRDYLYIHFADLYQNKNLQSFYNRLQIESDFFLKEINIALSAI